MTVKYIAKRFLAMISTLGMVSILWSTVAYLHWWLGPLICTLIVVFVVVLASAAVVEGGAV